MTELLATVFGPLAGIADYGGFCVAVLLFLALPGPGTFTLLTSTGQGEPVEPTNENVTLVKS